MNEKIGAAQEAHFPLFILSSQGGVHSSSYVKLAYCTKLLLDRLNAIGAVHLW
jgi:hypothetical protein